MNNRSTRSANTLHRLWTFVTLGKLGKEQSAELQAYAELVMKTFGVNDCDQRRDAEALRTLYVYKLAVENNILAKSVFPKFHFENWAYCTIYQTTQHIVTFTKLFHTLNNFLMSDVSYMDILPLRHRTSLDLTPTPPCPIQFALDPRSGSHCHGKQCLGAGERKTKTRKDCTMPSMPRKRKRTEGGRRRRQENWLKGNSNAKRKEQGNSMSGKWTEQDKKNCNPAAYEREQREIERDRRIRAEVVERLRNQYRPEEEKQDDTKRTKNSKCHFL